MGSFTQASVATISRFAADIGVNSEAGPDGSYSFVFSHWGAFDIVPSEDGAEAIISLSRTPARSDVAGPARLLDAAGRDDATQNFIHCGPAGDGSYVCAVVVDQRNFNLVTLNHHLEQLVAVLDSVG